MGKISTSAIYESRDKTKDILLGIIKNAFSLVTNLDESGSEIQIDHFLVEEPVSAGDVLRIVVHGQIDYASVRKLIAFELAGNSAVHIVAEYPDDIPILESYAEMILGELQPNRINAKAGPGGAAETVQIRKPNMQTYQRAMIWKDLRGWIKLGNVIPSPKECIAEVKKKPAYKNKRISTKRMTTILKEGFEGNYDEILKKV